MGIIPFYENKGFTRKGFVYLKNMIKVKILMNLKTFCGLNGAPLNIIH